MRALGITQSGYIVARSGIDVFAVHADVTKHKGKNLGEIALWLSHDIRKTLGKDKVEDEEILKEYDYLNIEYVLK